MNSGIPHHRANLRRALVCFALDRPRYLDMAVAHSMALNLEAPDLLARYRQGTFPQAGWEVEAREAAQAAADELSRAIWSALRAALFWLLFGALAAGVLGKVDPRLPWDYGKLLSVMGGFLAAWATLFELGGYVETVGGEGLHELLRPVLFRAAFLPGLAVAAVGQLWWQ